MRFWKSGAIAALVIGSAGAIQLSGSEAHGQVVIDRQTVPMEIEPFEQARQVWTLAGGGRLGVGIEDVTAETAKAKKLTAETGVLVTSVDADSPASKGGLKEGDVILEFDGERVRGTSHLRRLIQETPSGRKVALAVSRDGQRVSLTVEPENRGGTFATAFPRIEMPDFEFTPRVDRFEIAPRPPRAPRPPSPPAAPRPTPAPRARVPQFELFRDGFAYSFSGGRLGVTTQTLTDQLAKHFGVERGVLVTDVSENSAAAKAGIRAGDVITKVGGSTIDDSADLMRAIGSAKGEVSIDVVRDKKPVTLKATIEEPAARSLRRII